MALRLEARALKLINETDIYEVASGWHTAWCEAGEADMYYVCSRRFVSLINSLTSRQAKNKTQRSKVLFEFKPVKP